MSVQESVSKCHNLTHCPQNLHNLRRQLVIFLDGCEIFICCFHFLAHGLHFLLIVLNTLSVSNCMGSPATPRHRF